MNRRDLLKMIPGAAALAFFGLRRPKVAATEFISPDAKLIKPAGQMVWRHGFDDAEFLEKAKASGLNYPLVYKSSCSLNCVDIDPASPDGDYAAVATMKKTPEGHVVIDSFATNDIDILSGKKKVGARNDGKIIFSEDGGQTWEEANLHPPGFLYKLIFKEDKA